MVSTLAKSFGGTSSSHAGFAAYSSPGFRASHRERPAVRNAVSANRASGNPAGISIGGDHAPSFSPLSLINRNVGVFGLHVGHLWSESRVLAPLLTMLMNEMAAGRVTPVVARTFPLEQAAEAHRFIQARQNIGKVVLTT